MAVQKVHPRADLMADQKARHWVAWMASLKVERSAGRKGHCWVARTAEQKVAMRVAQTVGQTADQSVALKAVQWVVLKVG